MLEDKLLIVRFKQGSREALRQIYDKYKVELLRLAVVLTGDVNPAEDMVHDVFVRFAQSADRIKLTGSLKAYLAASVVNRVRNLRRDAGRHPEIGLEGIDCLPSGQRAPEQWAILSEQLAIVSRAMQELPYEQREVIGLRMETDMTFGRIGAVQGVSSDTAKARYRYGMEKLRSLIDGEAQQ